MEKVNFSGGEPFLNPSFLGKLVRYCKVDLRLPSVTIVSNGSLITKSWMDKYGEWLDILAISCDSFNEETNAAIGRRARSNGMAERGHIEQLRRVREWCLQAGVLFKINTTVCIHNKDEDMNKHIQDINPCRWKVFQCLLIEGENAGEDALRRAEELVVTDNEFIAFLNRHSDVPTLVPESNDYMRNSYLILDEYMRFLDNRGGKKEPGPSLLDVGVHNALDFAGFDEIAFKKRGGVYAWSKGDISLQF